MKGLDTYKISIDGEDSEELGINLISFVKNPAIKVKGFAFNKVEEKIKFSSDEKKMRIVAPAIIPMEIYRLSENSYEYNVEFDVEVIEKIRDKFMMNLGTKNVFNLEHTSEEVPAKILETWIVGKDPKADKSWSEFGIDVPTGTLMIMSQITDKNYYDEIVKNEQYAYSIEGFFNLDEIKLMIHKKQEEKMEELRLPDGEFKFGENIYTILDGKVVEIKAEENTPEEEIKMEEVKEEEVKEEIKAEEETPEEEVKAEEAITEEKVEEKLAIDETELMTILQPKFDEIYKMIADLKAEEAVDEVSEEETPDEQIQMTIHDKFSAVNNFLKRK
jgi:hypothetical protein